MHDPNQYVEPLPYWADPAALEQLERERAELRENLDGGRLRIADVANARTRLAQIEQQIRAARDFRRERHEMNAANAARTARVELRDAIANLTPKQVRRVRAKLLQIKGTQAETERRLKEVRSDLGLSEASDRALLAAFAKVRPAHRRRQIDRRSTARCVTGALVPTRDGREVRRKGARSAPPGLTTTTTGA